MWFRLSNWIKRGGVLPHCPIMRKELLAQTYGFRNGKLLLEDKEQIRKRLGHSTDRGDALALTFAIEEGQRQGEGPGVVHRQAVRNYDPLDD